jgi:hypothetical protein
VRFKGATCEVKLSSASRSAITFIFCRGAVSTPLCRGLDRWRRIFHFVL